MFIFNYFVVHHPGLKTSLAQEFSKVDWPSLSKGQGDNLSGIKQLYDFFGDINIHDLILEYNLTNCSYQLLM